MSSLTEGGIPQKILDDLAYLEKRDDDLIRHYEKLEAEDDNIGGLIETIAKIQYRKDVRQKIIDFGLLNRVEFIGSSQLRFDSEFDYYIDLKLVRTIKKDYNCRSFEKFVDVFLKNKK